MRRVIDGLHKSERNFYFAWCCGYILYTQAAYQKGITDAVLMHRQGRLKYKDYLDDNGERMVDIEIDPIEDDE